MKAATGRRAWTVNVAYLTLAGTATSVLIGALLGQAGALLGLDGSGPVGLALLLALIALATAREVGWRAIPLPQARRQTGGIWARRLGLRTAAVLWGLDLGLFVTTWQTLAGAWLVPVLAVLAASPGFGAALFAAHWLARALSVWIAPLLLRGDAQIPQLLLALTQSQRAAQLVHVAALGWAALVVMTIVTQDGYI
ncbi:MAG TPA: hypothetical protein VFZ00_13710 [Solirubrobacter sp.]|nr:hypothetical protein [Solirubrobacter sp.]